MIADGPDGPPLSSGDGRRPRALRRDAKPFNPDQRGVQSIEVGNRILEVLVRADHLMMLRDLAEQSGLTAAQAHAYLVSLRKTQLVEQDAATGRYRLGPFALSLGLSRLRITDAYQFTSAALPALVDRLGMMGTIAVWGTHGPTVVLVHESANQVHVNLRPGAVFSLTGTATGRLFAALLPAAKVDEMVRAELRGSSRSQRIADNLTLAEVRASLGGIRTVGYEITNDRPIPGISAIAAPVLDHSEQIQLAVTLVAPTRRIDTSARGVHTRELLQFTQAISTRLGSTAFLVPKAPAPSRRA